MILPSKHLSPDRALLTAGATILRFLSEPMTVSALWEHMLRHPGPGQREAPRLRYDAFILTLDLLFLVGAIDIQDGLLRRNSP